jgi:hypothetical protein
MVEYVCTGMLCSWNVDFFLIGVNINVCVCIYCNDMIIWCVYFCCDVLHGLIIIIYEKQIGQCCVWCVYQIQLFKAFTL